jgi:hypothetical protein
MRVNGSYVPKLYLESFDERLFAFLISVEISFLVY